MTLTEPSHTNGGGQVLQKDAANGATPAAAATATATATATADAADTTAPAAAAGHTGQSNTTTNANATKTTPTTMATTGAPANAQPADIGGHMPAAAVAAHSQNKANIDKSVNKSTKQVSGGFSIGIEMRCFIFRTVPGIW